MSDAVDPESWKFVQVDPAAPKKRRKRRKIIPVEAAATEGIRSGPSTSVTLLHSQYDCSDCQEFHQPGSSTPISEGDSQYPDQLSDFDRFILLSNEEEDVGMRWTDLFGENKFTSWTPLATTPIESALFDFCE